MRNYKEKMKRYRLPKERYRELRDFCLCSDLQDRILIEMALSTVFNDKPDALSVFIYKHVISTDYTWAKMEFLQIPCNQDTFRLYRAKFYFELDNILTKIEERGGL